MKIHKSAYAGRYEIRGDADLPSAPGERGIRGYGAFIGTILSCLGLAFRVKDSTGKTFYLNKKSTVKWLQNHRQPEVTNSEKVAGLRPRLQMAALRQQEQAQLRATIDPTKTLDAAIGQLMRGERQPVRPAELPFSPDDPDSFWNKGLPADHPLMQKHYLIYAENRRKRDAGLPEEQWLPEEFKDVAAFDAELRRKLGMDARGGIDMYGDFRAEELYLDNLGKRKEIWYQFADAPQRLERAAPLFGFGPSVEDWESPWSVSALPVMMLTLSEISNLKLERIAAMSLRQAGALSRRIHAIEGKQVTAEIKVENIGTLSLSELRGLNNAQLKPLLPSLAPHVLILLSEEQIKQIDFLTLNEAQKTAFLDRTYSYLWVRALSPEQVAQIAQMQDVDPHWIESLSVEQIEKLDLAQLNEAHFHVLFPEKNWKEGGYFYGYNNLTEQQFLAHWERFDGPRLLNVSDAELKVLDFTKLQKDPENILKRLYNRERDPELLRKIEAEYLRRTGKPIAI